MIKRARTDVSLSHWPYLDDAPVLPVVPEQAVGMVCVLSHGLEEGEVAELGLKLDEKAAVGFVARGRRVVLQPELYRDLESSERFRDM